MQVGGGLQSHQLLDSWRALRAGWRAPLTHFACVCFLSGIGAFCLRLHIRSLSLLCCETLLSLLSAHSSFRLSTASDYTCVYAFLVLHCLFSHSMRVRREYSFTYIRKKYVHDTSRASIQQSHEPCCFGEWGDAITTCLRNFSVSFSWHAMVRSVVLCKNRSRPPRLLCSCSPHSSAC